MSTKRIVLLMFAVATGTTLGLLLISDLLQGTDNPNVWTNTLAVATAVLVLCNVSLADRERREQRAEERQAEQALANLRGNVRQFR